LVKDLRDLPAAERVAVGETLNSVLAAWGEPRRHTGIGLRKLGAGIIECRCGLRLRLLFTVETTRRELNFFAVGNHDKIQRILRGR
jgi:mRNA-degrading endonuclease RelE of RelBE toxin-antitoxin system